MPHTLPHNAILALRNGTLTSPQSMELYEFLVRVSDKAWSTHFKCVANDWHSSAIIREDFNVTLLEFLVARKPLFVLVGKKRTCDIVSPLAHHTPALCYWLWKRKVPIIITLLTAKHLGVDYVSPYPLDIATCRPNVLELHNALIWLRKRLARDCADLYNNSPAMQYYDELVTYLKRSEVPHIQARRAATAEDAIYILSNRFAKQLES